MRKTLAFLFVLSFASALLAGTTLSYRERKKLFDQRIGLIFEVREVFALTEEPGKNPLKTVESETNEAYREGERIKLEKTMSLAEGEITYHARKLSMTLEDISDEVYRGASSETKEANEHLKVKDPSWTPERRDKSIRYLLLAKGENEQARKSFLSGNFFLSIMQYKRAISYSLLSYKTLEIQPKEVYRTAASLWVDPVWQKSTKGKPPALNQK